MNLPGCPFCGKVPIVEEWNRDAGNCYGESHISLSCCNGISIHAEYFSPEKSLHGSVSRHWEGHTTRSGAMREVAGKWEGRDHGDTTCRVDVCKLSISSGDVIIAKFPEESTDIEHEQLFDVLNEAVRSETIPKDTLCIAIPHGCSIEAMPESELNDIGLCKAAEVNRLKLLMAGILHSGELQSHHVRAASEALGHPDSEGLKQIIRTGVTK